MKKQKHLAVEKKIRKTRAQKSEDVAVEATEQTED